MNNGLTVKKQWKKTDNTSLWEAAIISSSYLGRVRGKYEERIRECSEAGKKNADTAKRGADGKFTANGGILDKIRLDKNISTTTVVEKEAVVVAES